jgi:hypothetical protein
MDLAEFLIVRKTELNLGKPIEDVWFGKLKEYIFHCKFLCLFAIFL